MKTQSVYLDHIDLTEPGAALEMPCAEFAAAGAQVVVTSGTWTNAVISVEVSAHPTARWWVSHPAGHSFTAEGTINGIDLTGYAHVRLRVTTISGAAARVTMMLTAKDMPVPVELPSDSAVLLTGADRYERCLRSPIAQIFATISVTSGTAYWAYLGRTSRAITPKHVEFFMVAAGSGAQTAEVAVATSPGPPDKAAQTLTVVAADGTLDTLTASANTVKRNTSAMSTSVAAGSYLWAGLRTALASSQPMLVGLALDLNQGYVLSTAASGVLTVGTSYTGALFAMTATTAVCPNLSIALD